MYEELVSALRNCGFPNSYRYCPNCVFAGKYGGSCDLKKLLPEVADTIEEMNRRIDRAIELYNRNVEKSAMYEALAGISPEPPKEDV